MFLGVPFAAPPPAPDWVAQTARDAELTYASVLAGSGCATAACLSSLPPAALLLASPGNASFGPTVDGAECSCSPWALACAGAHCAPRVGDDGGDGRGRRQRPRAESHRRRARRLRAGLARAARGQRGVAGGARRCSAPRGARWGGSPAPARARRAGWAGRAAPPAVAAAAAPAPGARSSTSSGTQRLSWPWQRRGARLRHPLRVPRAGRRGAQVRHSRRGGARAVAGHDGGLLARVRGDRRPEQRRQQQGWRWRWRWRWRCAAALGGVEQRDGGCDGAGHGRHGQHCGHNQLLQHGGLPQGALRLLGWCAA